jgi:hypothetical protein
MMPIERNRRHDLRLGTHDDAESCRKLFRGRQAAETTRAA